jgi:hypothetical protein
MGGITTAPMQDSKHKITSDVMAARVEKQFPRLGQGDLCLYRHLLSVEKQDIMEPAEYTGVW